MPVLAFPKQENTLLVQDLLKKKNNYLLKSLEISWLFSKNLKENYYRLYQQSVLLKVIYQLHLLKHATAANDHKPLQTTTKHQQMTKNHHKSPQTTSKQPQTTSKRPQTTIKNNKSPTNDPKPPANNHKRPNKLFLNSSYLVFFVNWK